MIKILFAVLLTLSASAFASTTFAGTRENFNACATQDPSWMQRWGQYVVTFDQSNAAVVCRNKLPGAPYTVKEAGCYLSGSWAAAGYYCEELAPGP